MKTYFLKSKALILILFCFIGKTNSVAQNYTLSPGKNFTATVDTNQLNYNGIEIINTGTTNLDFTWELLLKDTLIDSEFDLCNSGICFNTLPVNGSMPSIVPGQVGFLKMHMFSGKIEGVNTIKYILKNAFYSTSDTLTYVINVGNNVTSLQNEKMIKTKISLYPNPSKDIINIKFISEKQTIQHLKITDVLGNVVFVDDKQLTDGVNELQLVVSGLSNGVYFLNLEGVNFSQNEKIIIEK